MTLGGPFARLKGLFFAEVSGSVPWSLLGQVSMMVASTVNFLLLARLIGPSDYGAVAGAMALVLTIGPIATLGADKLVIRDIARLPEASAPALTAGLVTITGGAATAGVALVALHRVLLPQVPLALLVCLTIAELMANAATLCCAGSHFAAGRVRAGSLTMTMSSGAKIVAIVVFGVTGGEDPVRWALLYALSAVLAGIAGAGWAFWRFGRPTLVGYNAFVRAKEGLPYSVNVSSTILQNDVDKVLLVRAGLSRDAGLYSVAYRLATMAWLPVLAVLQLTLPRFFKLGQEGGIVATAWLARRLAPPLVAYAAFAGIVLAVGAPAIPALVGDEYQGSVLLLVLLAPLATVKVVQYLPSDALTGAGHQSIRTACIAVSTGVNLGLNLVFIPRYGLAAALGATFAAEVLYAVLVNVAVRRRLTNAVATIDVAAES